MFINKEEKVLTIEKSATNLELHGSSTVCKNVNTAGTDENLFRLVLGHGARVLPLEPVPVFGTVPKLVLEGTNKRLCSDSCQCPGTKSERGLRTKRKYM